MKNIKVLLVVPNFRWCKWDKNTLWHYIPYNLCLLAAMLENTYEVEILDANDLNMSESEFSAEIAKIKPDIVGITILMDQYGPSGHKAAQLVKNFDKNAVVLMGGVYATMNPQLVMNDSNIDYVVIGEGEYVLKELIGFLQQKNPRPEKGICFRENGKIVNKGHSDFISNLDDLPLPAYHLIDYSKYANSAFRKSVDSPRIFPYARIITSRGCPCGCIFCQVEGITGKKFRYRSAENVLAEIEWLKKEYNIKSLIFDDDNLFLNKKRIKNILQGMIDKNLVMPWLPIATAIFALDEQLIKLMKASGCEYIDVAIESGCERVLKNIIKKPLDLKHAKNMVRAAKREGIYVTANFIIGFPTETWDEIRQTIKFAEDIDVDYVKLFSAIPLRNTKLWDLCEKEGIFKKGFRESDVRWSTGQIETDEFKANDLSILRAYEWERINFTDVKKRLRTAEVMGLTEEELLKIRRKTLTGLISIIK